MKRLFVVGMLGALALGSCQKEELVWNDRQGQEKAFIRRGKLKQRPDGTYSVIKFVPTQDQLMMDISSLVVTVGGTANSQPVQNQLVLGFVGETEDGYAKFKSNDLQFTEDVVGQIVDIQTQFLNSSGDVVGQTIFDSFTVKGPELAIKKSTLKINSDGETFTGKVVLDRESLLEQDQLDLVLAPGATVTMSIIPDDGGSEADPETFELELTNETSTKLIFKNSGVTFIEPDNVVDMEYIAVVTVSDSGGEELDYAEFRITGQE